MLVIDDVGSGEKSLYDLYDLYGGEFPEVAWQGILRTPIKRFSTSGARLRLKVGIKADASGAGTLKIWNPQLNKVNPCADVLPYRNIDGWSDTL
jgi:hypothetical protein